ncbi:hypothetical protein [Aeromonas veronii]|uniref:hypothetical protein n=1 Tax=Aeromonas veronii TaxID=654 RepID=UPI002443DDD1|nr:hypothetical protein [Aeromonas veronii]
MTVHHIAIDGFGLSLLCQRVASWYEALCAGEQPAPLPLCDPAGTVGRRGGLSGFAACCAGSRLLHPTASWGGEPGVALPPSGARAGLHISS